MPKHRTKPADAAVSPHGWARLGDVEVTIIPLQDATLSLDDGTPLFARLTYADALIIAVSEGARLLSVESLYALEAAGVMLKPSLGPPGAETSVSASKRHDGDMWKQMNDRALPHKRPVYMAKSWLHGARAGSSRLGGLDKDGKPDANPADGDWQPAHNAHNRHHHDDLTLTMLERDVGPGCNYAGGKCNSGRCPKHGIPPDSDTDPGSGPPSAMAKTFGEAVLDRARLDLAAGVREDLGRNDGHRIREYTARHGRPGGGLNWCAAAVSMWIAEAAEATGVEAPIAGSLGAQATMAQLRAVGLFTEAADVGPDDVRAGCVPVWNRAQPGRPSTSWWGHVGVCVGLNPDGKTFTSIEGNAGPTGEVVYLNTKRRLDDPRLFGLGQLDDVPVPLAAVECGICEGVGWTWVALDDSNDSRTPCPKCDPPDMPEPIHEGSDPVDEAARLYAEWLGLPTLADPLGGVDD